MVWALRALSERAVVGTSPLHVCVDLQPTVGGSLLVFARLNYCWAGLSHRACSRWRPRPFPALDGGRAPVNFSEFK